jgi:hypothetical protein
MYIYIFKIWLLHRLKQHLAVVTIYDGDVNQANFNPATINAEMDNHLALNYGSWRYGTASYAYTYDRHLQTFQAGVNYVNYGNFEALTKTDNLL